MNKLFLTTMLSLCIGVISLKSTAQNNPKLASDLNKYKLNLDVLFEENVGQFVDVNGEVADQVLFKLDVPGIDIYVNQSGLTYVSKAFREKQGKSDEELYKKVDWEKIEVTLEGASIKKDNIIKELESPQGYLNYYSSVTEVVGVKKFGKITIREVYPNIDWVLYNSSKEGFKYDFVVRSGGNPNDIKLMYKGLQNLECDKDGSFLMRTDYSSIKERTPTSFFNGKEVNSKFLISKPITDDHGLTKQYVSFQFDDKVVGAISNSKSGEQLVIDPELIWATFFGGNDLDGPTDIACDSDDNVWIVGYTYSTDLPVQDEFQGSWSVSPSGFIVNLTSQAVVNWITYFGARVENVAIDFDGNAFVGGTAGGSYGPMPTINAYQNSSNSADGYIAKIDPVGNVLMATYYGGSNSEVIKSIVVDEDGNVIIGGSTNSTDFPLLNPFQNTILFANNTSYSDGFVSKFDNDGNLLWSTYYGGSSKDEINSLDVDEYGNILVGGMTSSSDFPVLNEFQNALGGGIWNNDGFLAKFDTLGNLTWSTLIGGNGDDRVLCVKVDGNNDLVGAAMTYDINATNSNSFPTLNAWQSSYGGNTMSDCVLFKVSENGSLTWSTFYAGNSYEQLLDRNVLAIDNCNNIYLGIGSSSTNLLQTAFCEGYHAANSGGSDQLISLFSEDGQLAAQTFFGGNLNDMRTSILLDNSNNLWITGEWIPPTGTTSAFDYSTYPLLDPGGGAYYDGTGNGNDDGMIAKFSLSTATNNFVYSEPASSCECNGKASVDSQSECQSLRYRWGKEEEVYNYSDTVSSLSNLCAGNYWVVISDSCQNKIDSLIVAIAGTGENIVNYSMPTVFTPNNDGENDFFGPSQVLSPEAKMSIYNRWGSMMFSGSLAEKWDGKYKGKKCPEGTYYWVLSEVGGCDGTEKNSGSFMLFR